MTFAIHSDLSNHQVFKMQDELSLEGAAKIMLVVDSVRAVELIVVGGHIAANVITGTGTGTITLGLAMSGY